jgi:hypothetical protein
MKINKIILEKAEQQGIIKSSEDLWSFIESERKSKISILNIIGFAMILFGIILTSFMLIEAEKFEIAGVLLFLTGTVLYKIINQIDKVDLTFKIGNLIVYAFLCCGVFICFGNFWDHSREAGYLIYSLKLVEIPALILACYFYIKNKNEYMLIIPFIIISSMLFMFINVNTDIFIRKDFWLEKVLLFIIYFDLILISLLMLSKKLITTERVAYTILITLFNIKAFIYFFDSHYLFINEQDELEFIIILITANLLLFIINKIIKNSFYDNIILGFCLLWLFMVDYFESLIFISSNIIMLGYGIYQQKDYLIKISVILLGISIEQLVKLDDILQIIYYIVLGIIFLLINKMLKTKKEVDVRSNKE